MQSNPIQYVHVSVEPLEVKPLASQLDTMDSNAGVDAGCNMAGYKVALRGAPSQAGIGHSAFK